MCNCANKIRPGPLGTCNSGILEIDYKITINIFLQVFVVAVLAVFPLVPRSLSDRAYKLALMGTACSSLYSLYSSYGVISYAAILDSHDSILLQLLMMILFLFLSLTFFFFCRNQGHGICKLCKSGSNQ